MLCDSFALHLKRHPSCDRISCLPFLSHGAPVDSRFNIATRGPVFTSLLSINRVKL
jgi:hypothetical protein